MKKFLLSLSVTMLSFVGAWAQDFEPVGGTSDAEGAAVRRITLALSGDWLNGTNVETVTTELIDFVMGYENGAFNAGKAFTEVTIKSADPEHPVTVNQSLVQQLVTGKNIAGAYYNGDNKIKRLDLSDVAVTHYVGHAGSASGNPNATFYAAESTCPIEYLAMPLFDTTVPGQTYSVPPYTIAWMNNLKELVLPKNAKTLEAAAFADADYLEFFHLNPGLEFIGNSAFWAKNRVSGMETLDVPASVKYIGPGAFRFRNYTDLYFHSAQAPICPVGKSVVEESDNEHPFIINGNYNGFGGQGNEGDDYSKGYANRRNYITEDGYWFTMVHFPSSAEMTAQGKTLDISSYKDDTRVYNKVYGNMYADQATADEKNRLQYGIPGKEQYYLDNEIVWQTNYGIDYVGKEESDLSYGELGPSDVYENSNRGAVMTGYEDTYRGLNYIWPSRTQYNRALVTVSLGLNWDGVTKYRPDLTEEQILLMAKDNLKFKDASGNWVSIADMVYTSESAVAHNEGLENAIHAGDVKEYYTDQDEVDALNALLPLKSVGDDVYYTEAEVIEHNAALTGEGAVHEGDTKGTEILSYEDWLKTAPDWVVGAGWTKEKYESTVEEAKTNPYVSFPAPYQVEVKYTKEEAAAANAELEGAISTSMVHYTIETQDQADAYNEALPGYIHLNDVKSRYTAEEALAWNSNPETNPGAVEVGAAVEGAQDYSDDLSRIAFQSTRRCVFADNAGGGDHYDPKMTTKGWWTICVPFDLTKAQIDKYFGVGTHLCKFNKVVRKIKDLADNERPYVKFYFTDDQYVDKNADDVVLEAHTPYMIFPMGNGGTDAVQTVPSIPMTEYYKKSGSPEPTVVTANDDQEYRFIGNYDTKLPVSNVKEDGTVTVTTTDVVIPQYSYFYAMKKGDAAYKFWFIQNSNMKWAANKCIIQSTSADRGLSDNNTFFSEIAKQNNGGEAKQITILGDEVDEDATAIDVIIVAGDGENSEVVYNLNGQMLNVAPQHGVYIKNGKKYIAK